jgi:hypothetical protein
MAERIFIYYLFIYSAGDKRYEMYMTFPHSSFRRSLPSGWGVGLAALLVVASLVVKWNI